ncbi:MAG: glycerophosphodiester phosphodiesterase family protein [Clostridia bacterium]|nr:glycerophosphodiester phosphodiesterase family protein [Clostridia bacterium]
MESLLRRKATEKGCLVASHRGAWGGNVIQNTMQAFRNALLQGADVLETDVVPCLDGSLWCFHDGSEKKVFGEKTDIFAMTEEKLLSLAPVNAYEQPVRARVPRFEEALALAVREGTVLNIDRAWDWTDRVVKVLDSVRGAEEVCLMKAPVTKGQAAMEFLAVHPVKYPFMAICYTWEDVEAALRVKGLRLEAVEMIAFDEKSPLFGQDAVRRAHDRGLLAWVNAIRLGDGLRDRLYAGLDDDRSIAISPEEGWLRLRDMGFDIIQTDWPAAVKVALEKEKENGGQIKVRC